MNGGDRNLGDILHDLDVPPSPFFVANDRLFRGAFRPITTTKSMVQSPRPDCDAHDAVPESALRLL